MPSHLTRNEREKCIMARVQRGRQRMQENFSLKQHGTWEAAEAAAGAWVEALLPQLPPVISSKGRKTRRNHSGVVGVHFTAGIRTLRSGLVAEYPAYIARWPGCVGGISFMLSTCNGEDEAFLRACLCRELETTDRATVEEAVRVLPASRRAELLALKQPAQTIS